MPPISGASVQNLVNFPQYQDTLAETQTGSDFIQYNLDVTADSQWFIAHVHPRARQRLPFVQEVGEFKAQKNYMTTRQGLQSYLLKVTLEGSGYLEYEGKRHLLQSGQFFWIDCRKMHYYATEPSSSRWHMVWVHFWGPSAHDYYQNFMELNDSSPVGTFFHRDAVSLIRRLIAHYSANLYGDEQIDIESAGLITQLMTSCLEGALEAQRLASRRQPPAFVPQVQAYITEHFREKITLDLLSETFFINKFYLQKQFCLHTGSTPGEFQRNLRIDKAKELLRVTVLPVSTISESLGFESVSYFIRSFKRANGKTPLQYRKEWCF